MTNDTKIDKVAFHVATLWIMILIITISWAISKYKLKSEIDTLREQVLVVAKATNKQNEINDDVLKVITIHQSELEKLSQY